MTDALAFLAGRALGMRAGIRPRQGVRFEGVAADGGQPVEILPPIGSAPPAARPAAVRPASRPVPPPVGAAPTTTEPPLVDRSPPIPPAAIQQMRLRHGRPADRPAADTSDRPQATPGLPEIASLNGEAASVRSSPAIPPGTPDVAEEKVLREIAWAGPASPPVPLLPRRAQAPLAPVAVSQVAPQPPEITVTIGRIEVRADPPARPRPPAPRPAPVRARPMTLEDHLAGRRR